MAKYNKKVREAVALLRQLAEHLESVDGAEDRPRPITFSGHELVMLRNELGIDLKAVTVKHGDVKKFRQTWDWPLATTYGYNNGPWERYLYFPFQVREKKPPKQSRS